MSDENIKNACLSYLTRKQAILNNDLLDKLPIRREPPLMHPIYEMFPDEYHKTFETINKKNKLMIEIKNIIN